MILKTIVLLTCAPLLALASRSYLSVQDAVAIQPVELNHVVIATDQGTYDAIVASSYLEDEFANGGVQRVVVSPDESYTGRYVIGENVYLEIFGPGGREGREPGETGLAFSTVAVGDIDSVYSELTRALGDRAYRFLRTRTIESEERSWFTGVSVDPPSSSRRMGAWIMESHADHLGRLGLPPTPAPTRAEYLRALRRARGAEVPAPARLMRDINRIDLVLREDERDDLMVLLAAGNWNRPETQGSSTHLSRPGLDLYVTVSADSIRTRLRSIQFVLTKAPERERQIEFGPASTLVIRTDGIARWVFR